MARMFELIGQSYVPEYAPVIEVYEFEVYIKFMSDGGATDIEQGFAMQRFLSQCNPPNGINYEAHRPRSLTINRKDFEGVFGILSDFE